MRSNNEQGLGLIMVLLLIAAVSSVVICTVSVGGLDRAVARNVRAKENAFYVAQAGLNKAIWQLRKNAPWREGWPDGCAFGTGTYVVPQLKDNADGSVTICSTGCVEGAERTISVDVELWPYAILCLGGAGVEGDKKKSWLGTRKSKARECAQGGNLVFVNEIEEDGFRWDMREHFHEVGTLYDSDQGRTAAGFNMLDDYAQYVGVKARSTDKDGFGEVLESALDSAAIRYALSKDGTGANVLDAYGHAAILNEERKGKKNKDYCEKLEKAIAGNETARKAQFSALIAQYPYAADQGFLWEDPEAGEGGNLLDDHAYWVDARRAGAESDDALRARLLGQVAAIGQLYESNDEYEQVFQKEAKKAKRQQCLEWLTAFVQAYPFTYYRDNCKPSPTGPNLLDLYGGPVGVVREENEVDSDYQQRISEAIDNIGKSLIVVDGDIHSNGELWISDSRKKLNNDGTIDLRGTATSVANGAQPVQFAAPDFAALRQRALLDEKNTGKKHIFTPQEFNELMKSTALVSIKGVVYVGVSGNPALVFDDPDQKDVKSWEIKTHRKEALLSIDGALVFDLPGHPAALPGHYLKKGKPYALRPVTIVNNLSINQGEAPLDGVPAFASSGVGVVFRPETTVALRKELGRFIHDAKHVGKDTIPCALDGYGAADVLNMPRKAWETNERYAHRLRQYIRKDLSEALCQAKLLAVVLHDYQSNGQLSPYANEAEHLDYIGEAIDVPRDDGEGDGAYRTRLAEHVESEICALGSAGVRMDGLVYSKGVVEIATKRRKKRDRREASGFSIRGALVAGGIYIERRDVTNRIAIERVQKNLGSGLVTIGNWREE